ncbi:uncharacterized protein LOC144168339 [Haemaphysalis longicornis]
MAPSIDGTKNRNIVIIFRSGELDWSSKQAVQLLLVCLAASTHSLDHHRPAGQPGYRGAGYPGFAGYTGRAPGSPYGSYADYASPPEPYNFGYDTVDEFGNRQFRSEQSDANNAKTGSYGYRDVNGLYRRVNYVADANGFRATVDTNEPGTAPGASADVVFNAAPVVPPVPSGGSLAYGVGAAAPYNGYAGNGRYGYGAFGRAGGAYGSVPYGGFGGSRGRPFLGGYANGYGRSVLAAGSYRPAGYAVPGRYNGLASGPYGYRRR